MDTQRINNLLSFFKRIGSQNNWNVLPFPNCQITSIRNDLTIIKAETQVDMKRLVGARSICLDAYCKDDAAKKYDVEIQRSDKGAGVHRARYHSSAMDVENLDAGQDFDELPDTYTIFITENDVYKKGMPFYPIERINMATGDAFNDGEHILYVNGAYRGEDEIGRLMHDFSCSDPDDMYNKDLADKTRYFKETEEGVETVCKVMEDMRNETSIRTYIEACIDFGIKDKEEIVKRLLDKFKFLTESQAKKYLA